MASQNTPPLDSTQQLIDQLVQTRADAYAETQRLAKTRGQARAKRAAANEKRQLAHLYALGVKQSALEQEQRNDAKELKAYLEEVRSPLIARLTENTPLGVRQKMRWRSTAPAGTPRMASNGS